MSKGRFSQESDPRCVRRNGDYPGVMNTEITESNLHHRQRTTSAIPSTSRPNACTAHPSHQPEFIRLPRAGSRCPWTSLSRASLNTLVLGRDAPVKSVVLRQRGANRGVRLISLESLLEHLHGQAEGAQTLAAPADHPELPGISQNEVACTGAISTLLQE